MGSGLDLGPRRPGRDGDYSASPMANILLVADLPWVTNAVEAALAGAGHHLTITADPKAAAALCREAGAELCLVDLQVGSMGGMAVVRDLRDAAAGAAAQPPATAILLDREVDAFLARRSGANAWLTKPFGAFDLRRLVDRLLADRVAATTA
jgi:DNA-binding response OmpR family regulator